MRLNLRSGILIAVWGAYFSNDHVRTPIIAADIWQETFKNKSEFKEFARNCIEFVYFDDHTGTVNGGMEV